MRVVLLALFLLPLAMASMQALTGVTSDQGLAGLQIGDATNPMALLSLRKNPYSEGFTSQGYEQAQNSLDNNVNSVMSMLMGSQTSSERNSIHKAIQRQSQGPATFDSDSRAALLQESPSHHGHASHHHSHHRHHHHESEEEMSDGREALIQEEEPAHHRSSNHHSSSSSGHHSSSSGAHHSSASSHHSVGSSHHSSGHTAHHAAPAHKTHRRSSAKSTGPSQIADVIEELEVEGDGDNSKNFPDPHLRDKLKHSQLRGQRSHSKAPPPAQVPLGSDEDDVPLDEFGLKKDCHWIQMDFTQSSDNCNQCMTVADAYFRGDDVCVCYRDKPGSPMRTKCNELSSKFKENEDHIRELAVENQWNEYFKSYGLCENFGHCGV